jgi:hypothetical protein
MGMAGTGANADLCHMQPEDVLTVRGFSLQQEHLDDHDGPDEIDIQALLRWYYGELNRARVTENRKPA